MDVKVQISIIDGARMISQTAEYALRAVVLLANRGGVPCTTAEIGRHTRVPIGYLAKVMQSLGRAELVHSQRGLQGGFTLAADPAQITILQVVSAVDPLRRIKSCPLGRPAHEKLCPLHSRLDQAIAQIEEVFGRTTIDELVDQPTPRAKSCRFPGTAMLAVPSKPSGQRPINGKKKPSKGQAALMPLHRDHKQ